MLQKLLRIPLKGDFKMILFVSYVWHHSAWKSCFTKKGLSRARPSFMKGVIVTYCNFFLFLSFIEARINVPSSLPIISPLNSPSHLLLHFLTSFLLLFFLLFFPLNSSPPKFFPFYLFISSVFIHLLFLLCSLIVLFLCFPSVSFFFFFVPFLLFRPLVSRQLMLSVSIAIYRSI